ncbi:MAG: hypothetical protein Kow0090_07820 [Myxococcota bacterium]
MGKTLFIIYVANQERSRNFYKSILNKEPVLDVPGMTEFKLSESASLGIMPEKGAEKLLGDSLPSPASGNGIPRCELYLFVEDPAEAYEQAIRAAGKEISAPKKRDWGDLVSYAADPDGHIVAFAKPLQN